MKKEARTTDTVFNKEKKTKRAEETELYFFCYNEQNQLA